MLAAAARLVLAATFVISAIAKLASWASLPGAMAAFGVPRRFARAAAVAVPVAELVLAVLLIVFWSSSWPAWIAVALLAAFTVLVVRAAVQHVPCPCFGAGNEGRANAMSVVRNGVLLALAVLATASPSL